VPEAEVDLDILNVGFGGVDYQGVRDLIEAINEQTGDGVVLNATIT